MKLLVYFLLLLMSSSDALLPEMTMVEMVPPEEVVDGDGRAVPFDDADPWGEGRDGEDDVADYLDQHEKWRLEQLLQKLSRVLNMARSKQMTLRHAQANKAGGGGGMLDWANATMGTAASLRKELEREVVSITTDDILMVSDVKSEGRAIDLTQERFLPRINQGRAIGMSPFTEPPNMNDLGCVGALPFRCDRSALWRTISGMCNNLRYYHWGAASTRFARFLPPQYSDGRNMPRGVYNRSAPPSDFNGDSCNCASDPKRPLPSARQISTKLHYARNRPHLKLTYMFTQFGQFLDHDITLTPENDKLQCCKEDSGHSECFPIDVPADDAYFPAKGPCLNFARSLVFCKENSHVREQMNAVTSFLDLSAVYGSTLNETEEVIGKNGLLRVSGHRLAPLRKKRYVSGDVRADEIPGLLGLHTAFIREHNRIADFFRASFPDWSGEDVFERARWVNIAQFQNIVYRQYLPILLGKETMERHRLNPSYQKGKEDRYYEGVDPTIRNSFAAAAFRFGHSMVQQEFKMYNPNDSTLMVDSYRLKHNFFNSTKYSAREGRGMTETIVGQLVGPSQSCDPYFVGDITNHLFQNLLEVGSDLPARSVQRGRDHGVPPYIDFRQFCGLSRCCSWSQRPAEISAAYWDRLRRLYRSPADIDLYTGGVAETLHDHRSGVVGPTFSCIIAKQFEALKFGDRFFYTLQDRDTGAKRMTPAQLDAVSVRGLGDVLCDNTDLQWTREDVFYMDSKWVRCGQHRVLDLGKFLPADSAFDNSDKGRIEVEEPDLQFAPLEETIVNDLGEDEVMTAPIVEVLRDVDDGEFLPMGDFPQ